MYFMNPLNVLTLWANSADNKLMTFFLFSLENRIRHFKQIVSIGDNLYEMSKLVFREKEEKYFNMLSAEYFTQHAKRYGLQGWQSNNEVKIICFWRPYMIQPSN